MYADAYKGALLFLKCKPAGYVTFVSHAGRDLMNGLPLSTTEKRSQVQYFQLADKIQGDWRDEWTDPGFSMNDNFKDHNDDIADGHLIPRKTCKKIGEMIKEHDAGKKRNTESGNRFFVECFSYDDNATVSSKRQLEWRDTKKWFQGHAHLRNEPFTKETETELEQRFAILHDFLVMAAHNEYERIGNIREILDKANS